MAEKPTRGRASKVWLLPEAIRNALNEMLRDKANSQAAILDEINGLIEGAGLPDDLKLSRSGLSRHASQVEQVGQHLRTCGRPRRRSPPSSVTSRWGDHQAHPGARPLPAVQGDAGPGAEPGGGGGYRHAEKRHVGGPAVRIHRHASHKREKEIRQAFAEEVAAKTEAIVTQAGLSGEAAAAIRREILGIA